MAIKHVFVEANVMNIAANFQLYAPYSFWGDAFLIFFHKLNLSVAMTTNQTEVFGLKPFSKYLQYIAIFTFPIISQWKLKVAIATKVHKQPQLETPRL